MKKDTEDIEQQKTSIIRVPSASETFNRRAFSRSPKIRLPDGQPLTLASRSTIYYIDTLELPAVHNPTPLPPIEQPLTLPGDEQFHAAGPAMSAATYEVCCPVLEEKRRASATDVAIVLLICIIAGLSVAIAVLLLKR